MVKLYEVPNADDATKQRFVDVPGCRVDDAGRLMVPATAFEMFNGELPAFNQKWNEIDWRAGTGRIYAHQTEAAQILARRSSLLLCDEMGAGKTRAAWAGVQASLANYGERHLTSARTIASPHNLTPGDWGARILIVAPRFLETVWRTEIADGYRFYCGPIDFTSATGADIGKSEIMSQARGQLPPGVYFIHYDILEDWVSRISRHQFDAVIFDEIHLCASARAGRSKAALIVAETARVRVGLTGTPLVNKIADLWVPLTLVHGAGSFGSHFDFRRRYCGCVQMGFEDHWHDTGLTNVDELRTRMSPTYLQRTLKEIAELSHLPPFVRERVDVDMDAEELDDHQTVLRSRRAEISDALNGRGTKETLGLITRLRQQTSKAKYAATIAKATQLLESGESVVIFVTERKAAAAILKRVGAVVDPTKVVDANFLVASYRATGEDSAAARAEVAERFQKTGGVLVATYAAFSVGVTLHRAAHVILHDLPWTFKDALQAESRIHRIGQLSPTRAHWMVAAPHTIDELVARVLMKKAEAISAVGNDDALAAAEQLDLVGVGAEFTNLVIDDALSKYFGRSF